MTTSTGFANGGAARGRGSPLLGLRAVGQVQHEKRKAMLRDSLPSTAAIGRISVPLMLSLCVACNSLSHREDGGTQPRSDTHLAEIFA